MEANSITPGSGIKASVLCKVDEKNSSLTGEFRIALDSKDPIRVPVDIPGFENTEFKMFFPILARDLEFLQNRWHTVWYDVNELILLGNIAIERIVQSEETYVNFLGRIRELFAKPENKFAFRLEMGATSSNSGLYLRTCILPSPANPLKNHTILNSGDVKSMNGGLVDVDATQFPESLREMMGNIPIAPTVFARDFLNFDDNIYASCVMDGFPSILAFMKAHRDATLEQTREYVKKPSVGSGNIPRYKNKRKTTAPDERITLHQATGTYCLSKFGTKKNIWSYIATIPDSLKKRFCFSKSGSTWDSYMTAWRCFTNFCIIHHRKPFIPVDFDCLEKYVDYLAEDRELQYSTIKSYLSALKFLHIANNVPFDAFLNPRLRCVMDGIRNECIVLSVPASEYRCVMTWNVLQIFGHGLARYNGINEFDRQFFWALCLFGFFGLFRMGYMLSLNKNTIDSFRVISCEKVKRSFKIPSLYMQSNDYPFS